MMEVLDVPKFGDTKLFVKKMEKRMRSRKENTILAKEESWNQGSKAEI